MWTLCAGVLRHDECRDGPRPEADGARSATSNVRQAAAHLLRDRRRHSADEHADCDDEHVVRDGPSHSLQSLETTAAVHLAHDRATLLLAALAL